MLLALIITIQLFFLGHFTRRVGIHFTLISTIVGLRSERDQMDE